MSSTPSPTRPHSISTYIEDGARILAILLVWAVIAAFFVFGISNLGGPGGVFERHSPQVGGIVALAGLLNAVLYLCYRTVDYWHRLE